MGVGLLAPVPAILIKSALETCHAQGRVAFGSDAQPLFARIDEEFGPGLPVIIVSTVRYGDPDHLARFSFGGRYVGYVRADQRTGLHPDPAVRPARVFDKADPDTAWIGFWEVSELYRRDTRVDTAGLLALSDKHKLQADFHPHQPMLVTAPWLE